MTGPQSLTTQTTNYLYDGNTVFKEYGSHGEPLAEYYSGANGIIAQQMFGLHNRLQDSYMGNIQTRGGLMYYQYDGLGNVMDITDRTGAQTMAYRYDAYGNLFTQMAAPYNDLGYTGQMYDAKAGLLNLSARWYNPGTGSFTTQDTYAGSLTNPMSLNLYTYAQDNPVNMTDPSGHTAMPPGHDGGGSGTSTDNLPKNSPTNPLLVWGSQGPYVELLQKDLNTLIDAGLTIDGIFGKDTYGAVRSFQTKYNLTIDGKVGPQTWGEITDLLAPKSGGGSSSGGSPETIEQRIAKSRSLYNNQAGEIPLSFKRMMDYAQSQAALEADNYPTYQEYHLGMRAWWETVYIGEPPHHSSSNTPKINALGMALTHGGGGTILEAVPGYIHDAPKNLPYNALGEAMTHGGDSSVLQPTDPYSGIRSGLVLLSFSDLLAAGFLVTRMDHGNLRQTDHYRKYRQLWSLILSSVD